MNTAVPTTTVLLVTGNIHEAAALGDYLGAQFESDDAVRAVGVSVDREHAGTFPRDRAAALNAVRARLGAIATVEIESRDEDDSVSLPLERAQSVGADEIGVGDSSLAQQLIAAADRPVVVANS